MTSTGYKYLPSRLADKLHSLEIAIRRPMDGHFQGKHHSHSFGSSVEFAEYRDYVPGDPVGQIDWPVYARTDRYVIRQYHEDVSIRSYIILDTSASMQFKHSGMMSKFEYGCFLAAGMAYLLTRQGDSVSLLTSNGEKLDYTGPACSFAGLKPVLENLESINPEGKVDIENLLHKTADIAKGRGLVIVISDLLEDPVKVIRGLSHLYHDGKEVSIFHTLDPAELSLPKDYTSDGISMANVKCMETGHTMNVDLAEIQDSYAHQVHTYLNELRQGIMNLKGRYVLADTRRDIYEVLLERSK